MKTALTIGLALLLAVPALAEEKKNAKLDTDKLVGTWNYTSGIKRGEKLEGDSLKGDVVITKDTITLKGPPDMTFVIPFKIGDGSPAKVDMVIKEGPVKDVKAVGIIAITGNTLKICYVPDMGDNPKRPEKFESTKDNGAFLFELKKKK